MVYFSNYKLTWHASSLSIWNDDHSQSLIVVQNIDISIATSFPSVLHHVLEPTTRVHFPYPLGISKAPPAPHPQRQPTYEMPSQKPPFKTLVTRAPILFPRGRPPRRVHSQLPILGIPRGFFCSRNVCGNSRAWACWGRNYRALE